MAASTDTNPRAINAGAMGTIVESTSESRVEKENGEIYGELTARLFREFMLHNFPFLEGFQNNDDYSFRIPANTFNSDEIESMLAMLDKFHALTMGKSDYDLHHAIMSDQFLKGKINFYQNIYGVDCSGEFIKVLLQLREFLIVEYLNSLNNPVSEHIVHNLGFQINETPEGYKATIQLENWAGVEDIDGNAESYMQDNLQDIIFKIEDLEFEDERREVLRIVLKSLYPLAEAIDFIRSPTMQKRISVDGKTETRDERKIPFQHFDIKPSNIFSRMLFNSNTGEEYLSFIIGDFGISLLPEHPRNFGGAGGTVGFIAPELMDTSIRDQPIDVTRADIYSFGVTLFYILVGHMPNVDPDQENVPQSRTFLFSDVKNEKVVSVSTDLVLSADEEQLLIYRGIATADNVGDIANILAQAMSTNPEYRYSSCTELMKDLDRVIGLNPIHTEDMAA